MYISAKRLLTHIRTPTESVLTAAYWFLQHCHRVIPQYFFEACVSVIVCLIHILTLPFFLLINKDIDLSFFPGPDLDILISWA